MVGVKNEYVGDQHVPCRFGWVCEDKISTRENKRGNKLRIKLASNLIICGMRCRMGFETVLQGGVRKRTNRNANASDSESQSECEEKKKEKRLS